jgi:hypothetical protein
VKLRGGLVCPNCSGIIPWLVIDHLKSFRCNNCGTTLRVSRGYLNVLFYVDFGLAGLLVYYWGVRGWLLLPAALVVFIPVGYFMAFIARRVVPPPLELSEEAKAENR